MMILLTQGEGVQNLGKPVDVILERSLIYDFHIEKIPPKINYFRPVRLGLWETFNNKLCKNDIPTRSVGTFS